MVLGADTRATNGPIVADKNCAKIHYIAPNIYCCGAGTAADTEFTTDLIASQLELHRLTSGRQTRVVTALTMLKQMLYRYYTSISIAASLKKFQVLYKKKKPPFLLTLLLLLSFLAIKVTSAQP